MERIKRKLERLTKDIMDTPLDSELAAGRMEEIEVLQELSKTLRAYDTNSSFIPSHQVKFELDEISRKILQASRPKTEECQTFIGELKRFQSLIKTWASFGSLDYTLDGGTNEDRKSTKTWDTEGGLTTSLVAPNKLTSKQQDAMNLLDDLVHDKVLLLGGSGSGKSFVEAYKIIRDTLRYKAPCLIARDKLIDLTQGMIDQIVPAILTLIAKANGVERWDTWMIDGLKFAKWTDKRTKLEFATGGYIRFAGLSARDLSESGSDKILSPSWLHVMLEEVSELEYEIVEKVLTRLRHHIEGVLNKLILCENPPSINHWSYRRFYEHKKEDGQSLAIAEREQHGYLLMNPQDNVENLGETYIRNLSQMSGANYERFFLGQFQDTESGDIFKRMDWTDVLPAPYEWDALVIYTDPTPLTGKEYSVWADYKASVLCGLFGGDTFVIDVRLVKGSTLDMLTAIKQLWDLSPNQSITDVLMEKKAVPSDFNQVLQSFTSMTGWVCPIRMDTRTFGEKKATIETFLQPLFENELIHFNEAFRETDRGRQTMVQILKFSRKLNKLIHDDIPDAIMRADTYMKGRFCKRRRGRKDVVVNFVKPAFITK